MIKLELSLEMLSVIGDALGNFAYRAAAPVITEIQRQVDAQRAAEKQNGAGINVNPVDTASVN